MKDRLTQLLLNIPDREVEIDGVKVGKRLHTAESVAEYLISKGVIVLPCKVGDTVYHYSRDLGGIFPYFADNLHIGFMDKTRNYLIYEANYHDEETDELIDEIDIEIEDFGKTVFLTREEAEKHLKGANDEQR